jgi:hypothetical protein
MFPSSPVFPLEEIPGAVPRKSFSRHHVYYSPAPLHTQPTPPLYLTRMPSPRNGEPLPSNQLRGSTAEISGQDFCYGEEGHGCLSTWTICSSLHICKVKQFFRGGSGLIVVRLKIIYEVIMPFQLFWFFLCVF